MKVAIIGTAPASRAVAPFTDREWTIWGCSPGNMGQLPRVDVWFELHAMVDMTAEENKGWSLNYFGWLKMQEFPVYMQEHNDLVPQAMIYPMPAMVKEFGKTWFTSSVAYMMALAIMTPGVTDIGLFGVDMAADLEHYTSQKAGCLRFIEIAKERGINVHVPFESCLSKTFPMYGYSEATHYGRKLNSRLHAVKKQRNEIDQQITNLTKSLHYFDGVIEELNYQIRTWTDGEDAPLNTALAEHESEKPHPDAIPKLDDFRPGPNGLLVPKEKMNGSAAQA